MTTEPTLRDGIAEAKAYLTAMTDEFLLKELSGTRASIDALRDAAGRMEHEIICRAQERKATAIITDDFTAELRPQVSYAQERLTPLLELLPEEGVKDSFIAEHTEQVVVPAKWKVQQALKWANKVGAHALAVIADAKMEGAPSVKLTEKKP